MKRLYQYDEQARHPHLLEENYFNKLNPRLVYTGAQSGIPGEQNVLHSHPFLEILFIHEGHGSIQLADRNLPLNAGDIVVINAGTPHCEYSSPEAPLHFYFTAYDKILLPKLPENHLFSAEMEPVLHTGDVAENFYSLFRTALKELELDKDFGYEIAQATARIILMRLFRLLNRDFSAKELLRSNKVMQDALRYIDDNYTCDISLEELAAKCLVSKYYLSHLFSKSMGKSIGKYILDKRMYMAKYMLSSTDVSVEQISLQCGFSDSAYFCRLFKKELGCTPTQFRKKEKNAD